MATEEKNEIENPETGVEAEIKDQKPTNEKVQMTDREAIDAYLNDEKVITNLRSWAEYFEKKFRSNWFTMDKVVKKSPVKSIPEGRQLLAMLILKGFAVQKTDQGIVKFKISLNAAARLVLLEAHRDTVQQQLDAVNGEIERVKVEIGNPDKK